jgi:flagellar basal-body rod protein FlgF
MQIGAYVSLSGAIAQNRSVEMIANNVSNASTAGFKKEMPLMEQVSPPDGGSGKKGSDFVTLRKGYHNSAPGGFKKTDNTLDLAMEGQGYFQVRTPEGNKVTRDGRFQISQEGKLVTMEGYPVQGERGDIVLTGRNVVIGDAGDVQVDGATIDTIKIVDDTFKPISRGIYGVLQGYVEESNVQPIEEMVRMLEALRGYQSHMKLLQGYNDIEEKTVQEMGRV